MDHNPIKGLAMGNRLLAELPADELESIAKHFRHVKLELGEVVHEPDQAIHYVYFPVSSVISMLYIMENGQTAEVGLTGREGVAGSSGYLGDGTPSTRSVAQVAGDALRMAVKDIEKHFLTCKGFRGVLLKYAQYTIAQISLTAACNRLHPVEQQFCRWLLINDDVHRGSKLRMTHELVANMLGCSRVSVSVTAKKFQDRGWIRYSRGVITITDRPGLEDAVCECYLATISHYERLFGPLRNG